MVLGMMKITVYTKPGCSYCVKAKNLLDDKKFVYSEIVVGHEGHISRDIFISLFPTIKTLPLIKIDDRVIGGYDDLVKWMNNNI